jgi:hypothetical protein
MPKCGLRICRLRGERQGATAPPAPSAEGMYPSEPQNDVIAGATTDAHAFGQIRTGGKDLDLGITEACAGAGILALTSLAGGLGGSSPAQRGARRVPSGYSARSHPGQSAASGSGEREGPRPLASPMQSAASGSGEREGPRPLASSANLPIDRFGKIEREE